MAPSATSAQIEVLLQFLQQHTDLARDVLRTADGRSTARRLWSDITTTLNAMGGCIKNVAQWQKVWADRKHITKKSAAALRQASNATGGGPSSVPPLTPVELKVLHIMGDGFGEPQTEASVDPFPVESPGASPEMLTVVEIIDDELDELTTDTNRAPGPQRTRQNGRRFKKRNLCDRLVEIEEKKIILKEKSLIEKQKSNELLLKISLSLEKIASRQD